ncbi:MAG TPA: DUF58 domain-containing protein [Burkholderiales bacterium]|nr:DUF58 domain-containing protein [Burkholderiales bacterium]
MRLTQRRVYILPTRAGLLFALSLVLMLIGSINYSLSLGYALTFLLAGVGVVSMLHTWRNLAHLSLRPGKADPTFAGERARFHIAVENAGRLPRTSLAIEWPGQAPVHFDVPPASQRTVEVSLLAGKRGLLRAGRFRIFTVFPLGLFYAWANVELDLSCVVYPQPEQGRVALPAAQASTGEGAAAGSGEDDFAGLRTYYPGDAPNRIAWKAAARSELLLTKQFSGAAAAELWLEYAQIPDRLGVEGRLSRLARWVLDASMAGMRYGLRVPSLEIGPAIGQAHRTRCLEALALYGIAP